MTTDHETDTSPESVIEQFIDFIETHSAESATTPDELRAGYYRLARYPGMTHENVRVRIAVTIFEGEKMEDPDEIQYSIAYHTSDGQEIMTLMCTPTNEEGPFWTSNGDSINTRAISPDAVLEVIGDNRMWENSDQMVPDPNPGAQE